MRNPKWEKPIRNGKRESKSEIFSTRNLVRAKADYYAWTVHPAVMDLLVKDCPQSVRNGALFREFCRRVVDTKDETDRWCVRLRHVDGFIILERVPETRYDRRISFPVTWLMSKKYMQSLIPELEAFLFDICSE